MANATSLTTIEDVLGAYIGAVGRQYATLIGGIDDPDTLLQKAIDLAEVAEALVDSLIDSGTQPLRTSDLARATHDQTPDSLNHLIDLPIAATDFGGPW